MTSLSSPAAGGDYVWPMELRPELTSRFCDYRAGHFHAGLDIRTMGRTGFRVYAIDAGHVFRITASFTGYGKAVYLRLNNGEIAVYGHLSGFGDVIDEKIRRLQMQSKRYKQDLYFGPGELPVEKGQVIGYSGSSGAGAPHLHFEKRSAANHPLNPLKFGFTIPDGAPPVFRKLAVRHYDNGFNPGAPCRTEIIDVIKETGSNEYSIGDPIAADDFLALAVSGGDRIDDSGFLYGFYNLQLLLDGRPLFSMSSDSIAYETTGQLEYIRDMELSHLIGRSQKRDNDENVFYRLYVPPGTRQFFWDGTGFGAGIIPPADAADQIRNFEIIATDEAGNRSLLKFAVEAPKLDPPRPEFTSYYRFGDTVMVDFLTFREISGVRCQAGGSQGHGFGDVDCLLFTDTWHSGKDTAFANTLAAHSALNGNEYRFRFFDNAGEISPWVYFVDGSGRSGLRLSGSPEQVRIDYLTDSVYADLALTLVAGSQTWETPMYQDGIQAFYADLTGYNLGGPVTISIAHGRRFLVDSLIYLYPAIPGQEMEAFSPDSTLSVIFKPGSAFYPAYVFPSNGVGARLLGGPAVVYEIEPIFYPADSMVRFSFDLERLGLAGRPVGAYGFSAHTDKWGFIGKGEGSILIVEGFGLGKVALIEDDDPPVISQVRPGGMLRNRRPLLSCLIKDKISGVDLDGSLVMTIDDIWVPAEYDIGTGRFSYQVRHDLRTGAHSLRIEAGDKQGNRTRSASRFTIQGGQQ